MEGIPVKHELKQIGPRIRADIAQMLKEQCASQRVSASLTIERLIVDHLKKGGYVVEDYDRY
jgi:hypothetical protein